VILGKLALQYSVSDDIMIFGSYTRGYKGQVYDIASSFTQADADTPVGAEKSDAFEVGIKSALFDNRVQLNATLFHNSYTDFQAQGGRVLPDGNIEVKLNNVGDLETRGVELDATALLTENLQISLGVAYTDATIKEFKGADCYAGQTFAQGCSPIDPSDPESRPVQDLSGNSLSNSPDWKVTLGGEYSIPLASMPFDGFVNFSYRWQDEVNFSLANSPLTIEGSYGIFNMSAGINAKNDQYQLTLFVNNLFDKNYVDGIGDVRFLFDGSPVLIHNIPRAAERYAGLRLKFNF
jgi:iron complex outermembrane receptor protein